MRTSHTVTLFSDASKMFTEVSFVFFKLLNSVVKRRRLNGVPIAKTNSATMGSFCSEHHHEESLKGVKHLSQHARKIKQIIGRERQQLAKIISHQLNRHDGISAIYNECKTFILSRYLRPRCK